jgi:hypothetical protein
MAETGPLEADSLCGVEGFEGNTEETFVALRYPKARS